MRLSKGFWKTFKETPADAEVVSHQLMIRSGLIHKSVAGIYNYLPIGLRTIRKIENIIREELNKISCHEITMSVVTSGDLWKESGRWEIMTEMLKFKDKKERDLAISPTNEEAVVDIFRSQVKSYKDLPITYYQINTKFRDEIRPRFGVMRSREFTMKDAYSFHLDADCLDRVYNDIYSAYEKILKRIELKYIAVEADAGNIGDGGRNHEFQVLADSGEDEIVYSEDSHYAANIETAKTKRKDVKYNLSKDEMEEVETIDTGTIEKVCNLLKLPEEQSLKSLVYKAIIKEKDYFILILLLGDDTLNEVKLKNSLKADFISPATNEELENLGFIKGFIGPFNIQEKIKILLDESINLDASYIVGAQKKNYHIKGAIPSRDFSNFKVVDLRNAKEGDFSLDNKGRVQIKRGIEVGHVFQLGNKYTKSMGVSVLDKQGKGVNPLMGCYGIGVGRLMASAIEQHHDENGIIWPKSITPYQVYIISFAKVNR